MRESGSSLAGKDYRGTLRTRGLAHSTRYRAGSLRLLGFNGQPGAAFRQDRYGA